MRKIKGNFFKKAPKDEGVGNPQSFTYINPQPPMPYQNKKRKRNKFIAMFENRRFQVTIFVLTILAVAFCIGAVAAKNSFVMPKINRLDEYILDEEGNPITINSANRKQDFFTVLIVGRDQTSGNTDTIMVVSCDVANNQWNVLSIPRDTMANVSRAVKKINAAHAMGGVKQLKKEVSDLIGFVPDKYAFVQLDAFEKIIDTIGGVDINVPQDMNYEDPAQKLSIHLKAGQQTLNGKQAIGFVRFRSGYIDADLGRIKAQQLFISALVSELKQPANLLKVPTLLNIVNENVESDFTFGELVWVASKAKNVSSESLHSFTLPGEPQMHGGLSYYVASRDGTLNMVNQYFNPYITPIISLNLINPASVGGSSGSSSGGGSSDSSNSSGSSGGSSTARPSPTPSNSTTNPSASPSPKPATSSAPKASAEPAKTPSSEPPAGSNTTQSSGADSLTQQSDSGSNVW
ncbi:MAG: LCP family protein [Clostridiales bacterium]|jgi:LCP family protein required for cell wall assembly|nr:LCP family protein [Clostridiales bacterium]